MDVFRFDVWVLAFGLHIIDGVFAAFVFAGAFYGAAFARSFVLVGLFNLLLAFLGNPHEVLFEESDRLLEYASETDRICMVHRHLVRKSASIATVNFDIEGIQDEFSLLHVGARHNTACCSCFIAGAFAEVAIFDGNHIATIRRYRSTATFQIAGH